VSGSRRQGGSAFSHPEVQPPPPRSQRGTPDRSHTRHVPASVPWQCPSRMPAARFASGTGRSATTKGGLQQAVMKRHVSANGAAHSDDAGSVADGTLLPKLGKLQDVTRQRRGDVLGARGAVKVQGKKYWPRLLFPTASPSLHCIFSL
jgi:hypothetical protein